MSLTLGDDKTIVQFRKKGTDSSHLLSPNYYPHVFKATALNSNRFLYIRGSEPPSLVDHLRIKHPGHVKHPGLRDHLA